MAEQAEELAQIVRTLVPDDDDDNDDDHEADRIKDEAARMEEKAELCPWIGYTKISVYKGLRYHIPTTVDKAKHSFQS